MYYLTKYRTELMGLAIIWIIFYHSLIVIPDALSPLNLLKNLGIIGVEIFFILSGLGLSFSYLRDNNIKKYFKKRFLRVLPTYWLFALLFQLSYVLLGDKPGISDVIFSLFGLDFLVYGDTTIWFVPSIIICYIIFPGYWYLSVKFGSFKTFLGCSSLILLTSILIVNGPFCHLLIFTIRLPVFFLGIFLGQLINSNDQKLKSYFNNQWILIIMFLVGGVFLYYVRHYTTPVYSKNTGLSWYPTILMAYPLCIFFVRIIDKFSATFKLIRIFGTYSLELYLSHMLLFSIADLLLLKGLSFNLLRIPEFMVYVVIALLFSVIVKKIFNRFLEMSTS